jgi:hypothetical protein
MNMRDERKSRNRTARRLRAAVLTPLAAITLAAVLGAATLTVTGSWTVSIGQANLSGVAGSDLTATYASATNAATLGVSSALYQNWRIDVYQQNTTWYAAMHIWVKRTNNGTFGTGTYSGGTTFIDLNATSQTFMTGNGNRSGFTLQFQLTGVSCAVPAQSYATTVVYTIVQI